MPARIALKKIRAGMEAGPYDTAPCGRRAAPGDDRQAPLASTLISILTSSPSSKPPTSMTLFQVMP